MIKEKKLSKTLVSIFLILATCFSIVFVANQVSKTSKDTNLSLSAVSDISDSSITPLSLTETYGIIYMYDDRASNDYDYVNEYTDSSWHGRIQKNEKHFTNTGEHRVFTLEMNVDPRDILMFNDDVIIEFKFYSQAPTLGIKRTEKIGLFQTTISFFSNGETTPSVVKYKEGRDKSSYGVTIQGGQNTTKVQVDFYYTFYDGYRNIRAKSYYTFGW